MAEITQQRDDQKPVWGDLIDLGLMCKVEQMLFVQRKSHLLCKTQTLFEFNFPRCPNFKSNRDQ